jgi:hypothetical protein
METSKRYTTVADQTLRAAAEAVSGSEVLKEAALWKS